MANYSIKDLENLSGVKAHTIRIWEKRYRLVTPTRSDTNIRSYSGADLRKIINAALLNNHGVRISRIAAMSPEALNQQVKKLAETEQPSAFNVEQLIVATIDLDERRFEKVFKTLVLQVGFEETMTEAVLPFLQKVGTLWQTEAITPVHEHFVSNLIRQKLIAAIDDLPLATKDARKAIHFLPEGEWHELGLLFAHYITLKMGWRSFYLGQSVPYQDLKAVVSLHDPGLLVTCITIPLAEQTVTDYMNRLSHDFPQCTILISGRQADVTGTRSTRVKVFNTPVLLRKYIEEGAQC